jgi:glycerophosphoryl diester phosphodiesterase
VHPFLRQLRPTLNIAHRGGATLAPENTELAFRSALERHHAQMLELDVHITRDGEVVVSHDPTVERCTDSSGAIRDLTLAQVQRLDAGHCFTPDGGRTFPFRAEGVRIPTLRQILRAFPGVPLNVDLKATTPGAAEQLAQVLRDEQATGRVCWGSEEDGLAAQLCSCLPEVCAFYPREALIGFVLTVRAGSPPPEDERYQVLDLPLFFEDARLINQPLLAAARAISRWINVWTVDDQAQMRQLVREGVGGIMTDRPDLLDTVLSSSPDP